MNPDSTGGSMAWREVQLFCREVDELTLGAGSSRSSSSNRSTPFFIFPRVGGGRELRETV